MKRAFGSALALSSMLLACADDPTQIVISVDTDYAFPQPLATLAFEVQTQRSNGAYTSEPFDKTEFLRERQPADFPLTLALTSAEGSERTVRVKVQGRDSAEATLVERVAVVTFRRGRILSLPMNIVRGCEGVVCARPESETCGDDGTCEPIVRDLGSWTGKPPQLPARPDAGTAETDGGATPSDSGTPGLDASTPGADSGAADLDADSPDPDAGLPPDSVAGVAVGYAHSCVWTLAGAVYCWGDNYHGQLGATSTQANCPDGPGTCSTAPLKVELLDDALQVAVGEGFSCALRKDQTVQCWGFDGNGEVGDGERIDKPSLPVKRKVGQLFVNLAGADAVMAGRGYGCAKLSATGGVLCWGANGVDQLGAATAAAPSSFALESGVTSGATKLWGAQFNGCISSGGGEVSCWGQNDQAELRMLPSALTKSATALQLVSEPVISLSGGDHHVCAVLANTGDTLPLRCWGRAQEGQLGVGDTSGLPAECGVACSTELLPVTDLPARAVGVSAGNLATCARLADGRVACWGQNDGRVLADDTLGSSKIPLLIKRSNVAIDQVRLIPPSFHGHMCVVRGAREVLCWGGNSAGQTGDDASLGTRSAQPISVPLP